jgi:hypothetical protein
MPGPGLRASQPSKESILSKLNPRRICGVGASVIALAAPFTLTAASASSVAALPSTSFGSFGNPLQIGGPRIGHDSISNWGGYVSIRSGGTFTSASASWTIAQVTCNQNALFAPWVGIDGDGSNTVEQTGAATQCSGGQASYAAWYEMFPAPPVYYNDPISVGDKFNASVTYSGGTFTLTIKDLTKGWTESVQQSNGSAQRLSAEAVIEGPGGYPDFDVQKFTKVAFNGQPLKSWNPTEYDTQSGSSTIYTATKIKHKKNFKMVPLN